MHAVALNNRGIDSVKFKILTRIMVLHHFLCLLSARLAPLRALGRLRELLRGVQVPPGGWSDRFRPRTHALSDPEQRGIGLRKFHFWIKIQVWGDFPYLPLLQ